AEVQRRAIEPANANGLKHVALRNSKVVGPLQRRPPSEEIDEVVVGAAVVNVVEAEVEGPGGVAGLVEEHCARPAADHEAEVQSVGKCAAAERKRWASEAVQIVIDGAGMAARASATERV